MDNYLFNTNLPHIYNSCGINALFVTLSYLDVKSNNELLNNMIQYCKTQHKLTDTIDVTYGIKLMEEFYSKYNIDHGYQNCRLLLKKIYNELIFETSQIEIGDDYEKIKLMQDTVLLDMEQTKSMVEYNKEIENKNNRLILLRNESFNNMSILKFNDDIYIPCLYIVCSNGHYITLANIKIGLVIYNDLNQIKVIDKEKSKNILLNLDDNVEFIGYIKFKPNN